MVKYNAVAERFGALAQPARLKIVERLARDGRLSVSQVAKPLSMSLPAVWKHVRILQESKIIACNKEGRVQYCAINPDAFNELAGWLLFHKSFWEASFERLEKHISNKRK
jgi:DNA-binding transcriptional ArsR family regulator